MKKIIAMLAICCIGIGLQAQEYQAPEKSNKKTQTTETTYGKNSVQQEDSMIPEKVRSAFNRDYYTKDINPMWKKAGENYRVHFTNAGLESIAVYDKNGKMVKSDRQLGTNDYPTEIGTYYSKNGGRKDVVVWEENMANGKIKYYVKENGHITWFDQNGKHLTGNEHMAHRKGTGSSKSTNINNRSNTKKGTKSNKGTYRK